MKLLEKNFELIKEQTLQSLTDERNNLLQRLHEIDSEITETNNGYIGTRSSEIQQIITIKEVIPSDQNIPLYPAEESQWQKFIYVLNANGGGLTTNQIRKKIINEYEPILREVGRREAFRKSMDAIATLLKGKGIIYVVGKSKGKRKGSIFNLKMKLPNNWQKLKMEAIGNYFKN